MFLKKERACIVFAQRAAFLIYVRNAYDFIPFMLSCILPRLRSMPITFTVTC